MDYVAVSFVLYGLLPITLMGLFYFWNIQKRNEKLIFQFDTYRSELYHVKNAVEYFAVYRKIIEWDRRLGMCESHQLLRVQLFELVKQRKDALGIKKNIRIIE